MVHAIFVGGLALSLLTGSVPAEVTGEALPPPRQVFDVVSVNGTGCPKDTVSTQPSPDGKSLRLAFSAFRAAVGMGSKLGDDRKNCQATIKVTAPPGYTYALKRVAYRGHAVLAAGATATIRTNHYFQGLSQTGSSRSSFRGPTDSWFQVVEDSDGAELVYAPCGDQRFLNLKSEAKVDAGSSDVATTSSRLDIYWQLDYRFTWKQC